MLFVLLECVCIEPRTAIVGPATRHVKAGSEVKLHCIISQALEPPLFINWFRNQKQIYLHEYPSWRSEIERIELPPKMTTTTTITTTNPIMNGNSGNTFASSMLFDAVSKGVDDAVTRTLPVLVNINPVTSESSDSSTILPSVFNTSELLIPFNSQDGILTTESTVAAISLSKTNYLETVATGNLTNKKALIKHRSGNDNSFEESSSSSSSTSTVTDWSTLSNQTGINELWTTMVPEDVLVTEATTTTTTTDYHVRAQMPMQPNVDVKQITVIEILLKLTHNYKHIKYELTVRE